MITPILITAMICMTLLIISKIGIDIRIKKDYQHTYNDTTSYTTPEDIPYDLKAKEPAEIANFVESTLNVLNDYLEDDNKGTKQ